MNFKRIVITAATVIAAVGFDSCSEQQPSEAQSQLDFSPNIGTQISLETANRWLSKSGSTGARAILFSLTPADIKAQLQKQNVGVALHHAQDEKQAYHILAAPIGT